VRSSDGSILVTVGNDDTVYGDNIDLRLNKTADAAQFAASTSWTRLGADHGLGTSCEWLAGTYTLSGGVYTRTEGYTQYTCNTSTGDVTITWPSATAGVLVLIKSGGTGPGGSGSGGGGGGSGLPDPGFNGIVVRTSSTSTVARQIAGTTGRVVVTNSDGVNGDPQIDVGSDVALKTTSNTWTAKQTFPPTASTAGMSVTCAALPSSPSAGDIACDSGDGNKLKQYNGTSWVDLTQVGQGHTIQDEGSPLTQRAGLNFTGAGVTCTDNAAQNRTDCTISGGGGGGGSFDPATTYDMTGANKVNVQYISHYLANNSTGTTLYKLTCLASDGTVQDCTTANASRRLGICMESCGTTGSARIAIHGKMTCQFDGSVTAGNWAGPSSSVNGKCTDAGTTKPAGAIGIILVTQTGAGNYDILAGLP
jgi:hypothetical protein